MLISTSILKSAIENFQQKQKVREDYNDDTDTMGSTALGIETAFAIFFIVASIILFIAELIILLFLISNAIVCTQPGSERTLHLILIIFFTYPYALLTAFFGNGCMIGRLKTNQLFTTQKDF